MKKLNRFLTHLILGLALLLPSIGLPGTDFSGLLDRCVKADEKGLAIANFGRFDLYSCQGTNVTNGYIYLVTERNVLEKEGKAQRQIEFYRDQFVGQKGGGLTERSTPNGSFAIGNRTVFEVLPYDDKIVFVLVDGRAYDILTFVCGGNDIEKSSETTQPDDPSVTPQIPK